MKLNKYDLIWILGVFITLFSRLLPNYYPALRFNYWIGGIIIIIIGVLMSRIYDKVHNSKKEEIK